jgi:hypothetical protein
VVASTVTCWQLVSCLACSSIVKMGAIYSSETLVEFYWTTRNYNPKDKILQLTYGSYQPNISRVLRENQIVKLFIIFLKKTCWPHKRSVNVTKSETYQYLKLSLQLPLHMVKTERNGRKNNPWRHASIISRFLQKYICCPPVPCADSVYRSV